jgi:invasion protein IalB
MMRIFETFDFGRVGSRILLVAMVVAGFTSPALSQTGDLLSENGNWQAYRAGKDAGKVCFITSQPIKFEGKYDRDNRGETRVFVTHHSSNADERGVVSTVAGYRYKEGRDVVFSVDGKTFNLFSVDTRAWAVKPEMDRQLVRAMKRGNSLKVTGISSRGNTTIDTYSLKGFTAAMKVIDKACP